MSKYTVSASYDVDSVEEAEASYDDWAASYEPDLCAAGYRIPGHIATVFTRFVPADVGPILDAGCGGGIQAEALTLIGYGPFVGMDLSEGMMAVAREKGIYSELHRQVMGERLEFADNQFGAVISSGCIIPTEEIRDLFDGVKFVQPGRRGAQRDVVHRASAATHRMGEFDPQDQYWI